MAGSQDNQNAEKHGGAGALDAIENRRPFSGLAEIQEKAVRAAFEDGGATPMIVTNAVRMQTVSDLYFAAFIAAAQNNDLAKMESALKVFGWVTNSAIRAWDLVRREVGHDEREAMARKVLDAIKQVKNDDDSK
jgi:hypothetical protein